ncbi:MAG: ABC transporter ATP-binding protein [Kiritimatiellaeota bacterium]|nr:ABC transporter ATP-binding protein [Kiritimatiellota bacterium]
MAVSIHIQNVTKTFGATRALDGVNLEIKAGELFFLLGPSGCGKTTLLRHIAGFYTPDAGKILIGERDVTNVPPHKRDTGMVFQSYALWPHLSIAENVAFGLDMRKVPADESKRRVAAALAMVKMEHRAEHKPNQLSGGQQQRVALARALVIEPGCLLLDEPLSNLDAKLRLEMRVEIRRICKEAGLTAVYVTHDQKEALSIADRLAVMRDGVIEQIGAPAEVYRKPVNAFVASFIGETNFVAPEFFGAGIFAADTRTLSIRPETIRLGDAPSGATPGGDDAVAVSGRLHGSVYLGETAQHKLEVVGADGSKVDFSVFELNPRETVADESRVVSAWIPKREIRELRN